MILSAFNRSFYVDLFQKSFVVRHNDYCALVFIDGRCQNFHVLNVQVICRLVQNDNVRRLAVNGQATKH